MFTVAVPSFVVEASREFAQSCNLGRRGDGSDGTHEQQVVGVIAQNMANLALGRPFVEPSEQHDGGTDFVVFGQRLDIKTMGRSVDVALNYVNNLVASQMRLNADAFLFASYNVKTNALTVCGWLPKPLFKKRASFFAKGQSRVRNDGSSFQLKADMYEVANSCICHKAQSWPELWVEVAFYTKAKRMFETVESKPEDVVLMPNGEHSW